MDIEKTICHNALVTCTRMPMRKDTQAIWPLTVSLKKSYQDIEHEPLIDIVNKFSLEKETTFSRTSFLRLSDPDKLLTHYPTSSYQTLIGKEKGKPDYDILCLYSYDKKSKVLTAILNIANFPNFISRDKDNKLEKPVRLPSFKSIGKALLYRRFRKGISAHDVAKFCGVSSSLICLIEKEKRSMNIELMYKICKLLECEPYEICDYSTKFAYTK